MSILNFPAGIILIALFLFSGCTNVTAKPSSTPSSSPVISVTPSPASNPEYIKTSTYFGHCAGYCQEIFTITSGKVNYLAKTNTNESPEISRNDSISANDYNDLLKIPDLKNFSALPERIGCPDCADGGGEWIEIKNGSSIKKTDFEFNKDIPEIKNFLEKLRIFRNEHKNPNFINQKIADFMKQPVTNPPVTINQYDYKGKKVYYISSYCCDFPSQLYDGEGSLICSPDGGITGRGDGKCSDFFAERTNEKLIWHDDRK